MKIEQTEILIIGAGPAGSVAAGLLRQQGRQVLVIEQQQFPLLSSRVNQRQCCQRICWPKVHAGQQLCAPRGRWPGPGHRS